MTSCPAGAGRHRMAARLAHPRHAQRAEEGGRTGLKTRLLPALLALKAWATMVVAHSTSVGAQRGAQVFAKAGLTASRRQVVVAAPARGTSASCVHGVLR